MHRHPDPAANLHAYDGSNQGIPAASGHLLADRQGRGQSWRRWVNHGGEMSVVVVLQVTQVAVGQGRVL